MKKEVEFPFLITALCSAFDFKWNKGFKFDGERHDFPEIVCVLDGKVESIEDEKIYVLSAGDIICHAPGEFHRIRSYGNTEPHVLVVSFMHDGTLPESLYGGIFSPSLNEISEYKKIFLNLFDWYHGENNCITGAEAISLLTAFIIRLTTFYMPRNISSSGRRAGEYRRVVEVMQSTVCENLTLPEIAIRAAISVSSIKTLFLTFSNISPIKYYCLLRIEKAKGLLNEGLSVSEISEKMHFSSPNYFCSFFKGFVGVPPTKFK